MGWAEVGRPCEKKKIQKEYGLRKKSRDTRGELGEVQSQNLIWIGLNGMDEWKRKEKRKCYRAMCAETP